MDNLSLLECKSIFIIREAYWRFKGNIAMLWSMGKDSTTLLWLCKKAFFGKIPFPIIHMDTGYKFPQMYEFRDKIAKEWDLNLIIGKNEEKLKEGMSPDKGAITCCTELKTNALKSVIKKNNFKAILLGIRRDEHGIRAKERYFSPRDEQFQWNYNDQPPELWDQYNSTVLEDEHFRIHPLLHFVELDIWDYIKREDIPVISLYFSKEGKRYRSIGCVPCTHNIDSNASSIDEIIDEIKNSVTAERAGRSQDKEDVYTMQKLRALGYM